MAYVGYAYFKTKYGTSSNAKNFMVTPFAAPMTFSMSSGEHPSSSWMVGQRYYHANDPVASLACLSLSSFGGILGSVPSWLGGNIEVCANDKRRNYQNGRKLLAKRSTCTSSYQKKTGSTCVKKKFKWCCKYKCTQYKDQHKTVCSKYTDVFDHQDTNGEAYGSRTASVNDAHYHSIDTEEMQQEANVKRGSPTTSSSYWNWVTGG
jgi:hypothetical protein